MAQVGPIPKKNYKNIPPERFQISSSKPPPKQTRQSPSARSRSINVFKGIRLDLVTGPNEDVRHEVKGDRLLPVTVVNDYYNQHAHEVITDNVETRVVAHNSETSST